MALQVMPVELSDVGPSKTYFVKILWFNLRELEAGLNCKLRKPRIMFLTAQPLLGHRKLQLSIADDTCGRIMHS